MGLATPEYPLPVNAFVTVSFWIRQREGTSHHRVLAQVVHSRPLHTGLMFIDPGTETLRALRTVQGNQGNNRDDHSIFVSLTHAA